MAIVPGTNMDESIYNGIDLQYRHLILNPDDDKKDMLPKSREEKSNSFLAEVADYAASVKGFVDTSQMVVPRQNGKLTKAETIKALADGIKKACVPRMLADINRCGLYVEEKMRFVWNAHWAPSRFAALGVRVESLKPNPNFRENRLLPTLPILCIRVLFMLNGIAQEAFVKAYYNSKMDNNDYPMIEVTPIDIDEYIDAVPIQLTQYEIDAVGKGFFQSFKEAYKRNDP